MSEAWDKPGKVGARIVLGLQHRPLVPVNSWRVKESSRSWNRPCPLRTSRNQHEGSQAKQVTAEHAGRVQSYDVGGAFVGTAGSYDSEHWLCGRDLLARYVGVER